MKSRQADKQKNVTFATIKEKKNEQRKNSHSARDT
jgi:hypothetical protein